MAADKREDVRISFKPEHGITILFIGESLPANPETFFYLERGALFLNTRQAFEEAGSPWRFEGELNFLRHFSGLGCYLVDLCNTGETVETKSCDLLRGDVEALSNTIRQFRPEKIVVVIKRITPYVVEALRQAGDRAPVPDCALPFPAHGHQNEYRENLKVFLKQMPGAGRVASCR